MKRKKNGVVVAFRPGPLLRHRTRRHPKRQLRNGSWRLTQGMGYMEATGWSTTSTGWVVGGSKGGVAMIASSMDSVARASISKRLDAGSISQTLRYCCRRSIFRQVQTLAARRCSQGTKTVRGQPRDTRTQDYSPSTPREERHFHGWATTHFHFTAQGRHDHTSTIYQPYIGLCFTCPRARQRPGLGRHEGDDLMTYYQKSEDLPAEFQII